MIKCNKQQGCVSLFVNRIFTHIFRHSVKVLFIHLFILTKWFGSVQCQIDSLRYFKCGYIFSTGKLEEILFYEYGKCLLSSPRRASKISLTSLYQEHLRVFWSVLDWDASPVSCQVDLSVWSFFLQMPSHPVRPVSGSGHISYLLCSLSAS